MFLQGVQIALLALIQGATELLPVSSSAHVILAQKLMGWDPSTPQMTFLLVMLHTGTMGAVLFYFWPQWRSLSRDFLIQAGVATGATAMVGLGLKFCLESIMRLVFVQPDAEIEHLFKSLPLMAISLASVGILIFFAGTYHPLKQRRSDQMSMKSALIIGIVQGFCLPFRGFSRSGATISTGLLLGLPRLLCESFSFVIVVILTPPILVRETLRLKRELEGFSGLGLRFGEHEIWFWGLFGMVLSFFSGWLALKWLSSCLEKGHWKWFGIYCILLSLGVAVLSFLGF